MSDSQNNILEKQATRTGRLPHSGLGQLNGKQSNAHIDKGFTHECDTRNAARNVAHKEIPKRCFNNEFSETIKLGTITPL